MKRSKMLGMGKGFTIVELLIATTVFSVILLIVTTGIIKIGNTYYHNITTTRTQTVVRSIANDLVSTVQFTSFTPSPSNSAVIDGFNYFCIDKTRYKYKIGSQYKKGSETTSGMFTETLVSGASCDTVVAGDATNQRQLLGNNMRLANLDITSKGSLVTINVKVVYGDNDLLTTFNTDGSPSGVAWPDVQCKSGISGGSFCAVGSFETTVKKLL